jgi:hypothetical protein
MPNPRRLKGDRRERQTLSRLRSIGLPGCRVPLSGAAGGDFTGDLRVRLACCDLTAEVKGRRGGEGWKTVKSWLATHDMLFLIEDRRDPLVVMPWKTFALLVEALDATDDARGAGVRGPVGRPADDAPPVPGL